MRTDDKPETQWFDCQVEDGRHCWAGNAAHVLCLNHPLFASDITDIEWRERMDAISLIKQTRRPL